MARDVSPFFRYLDLNGDGTGSKDATGDYSGTADIFYLQPAAGEVYEVARLIVMIRDTGSIDAGGYGNGAALTNGITVRHQDSGGTVDELTDGIPIKRNAQWGALCYDVDVKTWGTGDELVLVRWTFFATGQRLKLEGDASDRLEVVLNDNFTGLNEHTFMAQGLARTGAGADPE